MATTEAENKELVRHLVKEVMDEGNLDLIDENFADDFVLNSNAAPEPVHGPEEYKEFVAMNRTAFPDLEVTVEDAIAEDDKVVSRTRNTGTHDGELMGIEPTGTEVEVQAIVIDRIKDGQIVESWLQNDMLGLMHQLGAVEPPGE